jgi:PhnB protein
MDAEDKSVANKVKPIPDGYHSITPYLTVTGAAKLIDFLKRAFDATETERMIRPDGTVHHAELQIGDSKVMLGECAPPRQPMPSMLYLYVPDVDTTYGRAIEAGAKSIMEPADQFYGDRHGGVEDSSGNQWFIATHIEDVAPEEMKRRAAAAAQKATGSTSS